MTAHRTSVVVFVAASWLLGCTGLSESQRSTLRRWLLCDDCSSGQLDSVAALGARAAPTLVRSLLEGPLPGRRQNVRSQVGASYDQLVARVAPDTLPVTRQVYVDEFVENYVAAYQLRAVVALQRIGSSAAIDGFRRALALPTPARGDVLRAIGAALGAAILKQSPDSQVAPANTFVAVPPRVAVRDTAGTPLRDVRVTFAIDSGGGTVIDSVRRTDSNGNAAVGAWRLGPTPGRKVLRAVAAGRVVRFVAIATP